MDCTPPGSSVSGILQARTLEWTAISFPNAGKWKVKVKSLSHAYQAPSSMGFSRQEHWSGLPFPSPMHESEKWKWSRSVMPTRLLRPWDFPGKSTGVGCHCLLLLVYSEVAQSCPTLCNPMDCSPPGSSLHGIFQARILEWVAFSFSRGSSRPTDQTQVSCIVGRRFTLWATREANFGHRCRLKSPKQLHCWVQNSLYSPKFQIE